MSLRASAMQRILCAQRIRARIVVHSASEEKIFLEVAQANGLPAPRFTFRTLP